MNLLEKVIELQNRNGYTDQQMADAIGCSRPTYQRTRTGKIPAGSAFIRGAMKLLYPEANRTAEISRETSETKIKLELGIDGSGQYEIATGIMLFDHMLAQLARHGRFNLKIKASGDDQHHLVEDVAICLGKALGETLGEKRGITRMGDAIVPMDDALSMVAVDISGRGYSVLELPFSGNDMAGFPTDLIRHFLESLAIEGRLNLYARVLNGTNDHHKAEALFKALGRALDIATRVDERLAGELPTTKGRLEE
jgi:imidazoleglycerol-phosphate dehydratase